MEIEMPYKDPEKNRECKREWERKNKEKRREYKDPEKHREYQRQYHRDNKERRNKMRIENYRKKHPNYKSQITHYDFETHQELAMSSGIESVREWRECHKMGLIPDGIYRDPDIVFRRK